MSSKEKNLSSVSPGIPSVQLPKDSKVGIVTAAWNEEITFAMRDACIQTLEDNGLVKENLISITVPGAFELPTGAKLLLSQHSLDAVVCIGCVIKGETKHDEYISQAVAQGVMHLSLLSGKPVIFGVLTPNDRQQAIDRAGGKYGNKGIEAALTAIQMMHLSVEIKQADKKKIGF